MFRSRASRERDAARPASAVVFPVVPRRGAALLKAALLLLVLAALGASAAGYLKDAPELLNLQATLTTPAAVAAPAPTLPTTSNAAASATPAPVREKPRAAPPAKTVATPLPARPAKVERPPAPKVLVPPPAPVDTAPHGPGTLFVSSTPWGTVSVDGNAVGNSPIVGLSLPSGEHRIRIVRDGFDPFDRIVTMGAGEAVRLTGIVLSARHRP